MAIEPDFIGVIGDSLTRQNGLGESEIANLLVAEGWQFSQIRVSGIIGRTIVDGSNTPTTEETWADWIADGFDPRVVVLNLGANQHNQTETQWETAFDQLLTTIGSLASREIYIFNLAFADPNHANTARFHTWLATYAATNSFHVIDWWQLQQDRVAIPLPIDWKPDDASGRHMLNTADGYGLPNNLLAATVAAEAPSTPPPPETRAPVVFFERFPTGTAGSTILVGETAFNLFSGTSTAHVRSTDTPYGRGFSAHTTTLSTNFRRMEHTSGSYAQGCVAVAAKLTSLPTGGGSSMPMTRNQGATPASGLRIDSSAFARLQDNTLLDASSDPITCPVGAWYMLEARWRADTDLHQMRVWDIATRTILWTSAELALTAFTTIEDVFFGHQSAAGVWEYRQTYMAVSDQYEWIGLFEQWTDVTIQLPIDFVVEAHLVPLAETTSLDGTLPALGGSFTVAAESVASLAGELPVLQGNLTLDSAAEVTLTGNLATLSGTFDAVAAAETELTGQLPGMTGQLALSLTTEITLTGQLPSLSGSATLSSDTDITLAGTLPAITASFELDTGATGLLLDGQLPTLTGVFASTSRSETELIGTLSALAGSLAIGGDSTVTLDSVLPVIQGGFTITVAADVALTLGGVLSVLDGNFEIDSGDRPVAPGRPIHGFATSRPIMELADPRPLK